MTQTAVERLNRGLGLDAVVIPSWSMLTLTAAGSRATVLDRGFRPACWSACLWCRSHTGCESRSLIGFAAVVALVPGVFAFRTLAGFVEFGRRVRRRRLTP